MGIFVAFLGVSSIIIVTPGPDTALVIRNTLLGDRTAGVFAALGIAAGQIIWALTTSLGVLGILTASRPIFIALRYAGAAYLVVLGAQALHKAVRPSPPEEAAQPSAVRGRLTAYGSLRQGLFSNLSNPKMAIFFASLLPQFVRPDGAPFSGLLLRGCIFALLTFSWLTVYSAVVAKVGAILRQSGIRRALEGLTGLALVVLGLRIAAEHR